ncbi:MAG: glycosyltransferase family 4 protein [Alphaproteobacteria bacterium]|nr:glycosyltransferase family 4 protein [Alphaproteobacteria bacterium]
MSIREILRQLSLRGWEVAIIGATIFDAPAGVKRVGDQWDDMRKRRGKVISVREAPLVHNLLVTASTDREAMTTGEQSSWYHMLARTLNTFKPDLVFYYGGHPFDYVISDSARMHRIPNIAYVANGNYWGTRWCRDVDLVVTDSKATAALLQERCQVSPTAIGKFIDPAFCVPEAHSRERVLFINPQLVKGAGVVVVLALMLETLRPDIKFEVVESRGSWATVVRMVTAALGTPRDTLPNVIITPNSPDLRAAYSRARILLAPSLWWESGPRVAAEAMLNGIPTLYTRRGGAIEMVGDGGVEITLPEKCYAAPYTTLPTQATLRPAAEAILRLFDDEAFYSDKSAKAYRMGHMAHDLQENVSRLIATLEPLMAAAEA